MMKAQTEAALQRHLEALSHLLRNVRGDGGSCRLCTALRGQQHLRTCPAWPLIDSRITFRMEQEKPPPVLEVLRNDVDQTCRRRA